MKKKVKKTPKTVWGVFLNARHVHGPFKCHHDEGRFYDKEGGYEATMTFDSLKNAQIYAVGAKEARRLIYDWIFSGDSNTVNWASQETWKDIAERFVDPLKNRD
jgi:hypothetical protein